MQRFKNLLAVVDDLRSSRGAVEAAAALAHRNGARLSLVGLVALSAGNQPITLHDGTRVDTAGLLADDRRTELTEMAGALGLPDVQIDVFTGVGFVEIIKRVQRDAHDIVFCSPAEGPGRSLAGSSLVMHLLRKCPVPVWVETPRGDPSPDVAVALGPFGPREQSLNERLVQLGGSLTAIRGGRLHLIHAWRLEGESLLRRGRIRQPGAHVDELVRTAFLEASANMEHLSARAEVFGVPHEVHLEKGLPGTALPAAMARLRPGVLVMGTLARTGLQGMLIGNTAERVLGIVESSVLAVKPDDFVSPIAPD